MKIRKDLLQLYTAKRTPDGMHQLAAEEKPVARVLSGGIPLSGTNGKLLGEIGGRIVAETTAGEVARSGRYACIGCRHFDNSAWHVLKRKWELDEDNRYFVQNLRQHFMTSQNTEIGNRYGLEDDDVDIEAGVNSMGFCHALSNAFQRPMIVVPFGFCADPFTGVPLATPERPQAMWQAKSRAHERVSTEYYDNILKTADGKIVGTGQ